MNNVMTVVMMTIPQIIPRRKSSQEVLKTWVFSSTILNIHLSQVWRQVTFYLPSRAGESVDISHILIPNSSYTLDNLERRVPADVVAPLVAPGRVTRPQGVVVVITIPGPGASGRRNFTSGWAVPGATEAASTLTPHDTLTEQVTPTRENY